MRVILAAALAAVMLSGCAINWPTKTSGPRFSWSSDADNRPDHDTAPPARSLSPHP